MWYNRRAWGDFASQNIFSALFSLFGDSPSGKALGSGPSIRGFESLIPSHKGLFRFWKVFFGGSTPIKRADFGGANFSKDIYLFL